jgi:hypothetical protein
METVADQDRAAFCKGDLMTRCFYTSRDNSLPFGASSICQILRYVEDAGLVPNNVMQPIHMDGLPRAHAEVPLALREVVCDSIEGVMNYLDQVESIIPSLVLDFRDTPGLEAFQNLLQLYEGLHCITLLVDMLTGSFHLNLDGVCIQGIFVPEHRRRFISILKRLIDSQVKKDFIQIPELLQYEIAALLPVWREMFGIILKKVMAGQELRQMAVMGESREPKT